MLANTMSHVVSRFSLSGQYMTFNTHCYASSCTISGKTDFDDRKLQNTRLSGKSCEARLPLPHTELSYVIDCVSGTVGDVESRISLIELRRNAYCSYFPIPYIDALPYWINGWGLSKTIGD